MILFFVKPGISLDSGTKLYQKVLKWYKMYRKGTKLYKNVPKCTEKVQNCTKMYQNVPKRYKIVQNGTVWYRKGTKLYKNVPKCTEKVQNCTKRQPGKAPMSHKIIQNVLKLLRLGPLNSSESGYVFSKSGYVLSKSLAVVHQNQGWLPEIKLLFLTNQATF
jgi:hypothetical protein